MTNDISMKNFLRNYFCEMYNPARYWVIEKAEHKDLELWHKTEEEKGRLLIPLEIKNILSKSNFEFPKYSDAEIKNLKYQIQQQIWKLEFSNDDSDLVSVHKIDQHFKENLRTAYEIVWQNKK